MEKNGRIISIFKSLDYFVIIYKLNHLKGEEGDRRDRRRRWIGLHPSALGRARIFEK